jgi:hypothetical protein
MNTSMTKNPSLLRKQEGEVQWIKGMLVSAQKRGWFGKITIEIKKGMIDLVRSEETLKPPLDS